MKFSVLMSVYEKENPDYLHRSLDSLLKQSKRPSEVVLVEDGRLTPALRKVADQWKKNQVVPLRILKLSRSNGLGLALRAGLRFCRYQWVARMDSDDISLPDRFKWQTEYIRRHPYLAAVGGYIAEFEGDPRKITGLRKVPLTDKEIVRFSKFRNPMNHMTVMFDREAVQAAGGYRDFRFFEDYDLWVRMLAAGMKFNNIPQVLVYARFNSDSLKRRAGMEYRNNEVRLFKEMAASGHIGFLVFWSNIAVRNMIRLGPGFLQKFIYKYVVRFKNQALGPVA